MQYRYCGMDTIRSDQVHYAFQLYTTYNGSKPKCYSLASSTGSDEPAAGHSSAKIASGLTSLLNTVTERYIKIVLHITVEMRPTTTYQRLLLCQGWDYLVGKPIVIIAEDMELQLFLEHSGSNTEHLWFFSRNSNGHLLSYEITPIPLTPRVSTVEHSRYE